MIDYLFQSSFFFKIKSLNCKQFISELEQEVLHDDKLAWAEDCKVITTKLDPRKYMKFMGPNLERFSSAIKSNFRCDINNMWMNSYKIGYHQEVHDHILSDFSGVFFLNSGHDFAKFYFYDRNYCNASANVNRLLGMSSKFHVDVSEGDLIIFPSHILHGVTPHNSDVVRKTMSFNLRVVG